MSLISEASSSVQHILRVIYVFVAIVLFILEKQSTYLFYTLRFFFTKLYYLNVKINLPSQLLVQ